MTSRLAPTSRAAAPRLSACHDDVPAAVQISVQVEPRREARAVGGDDDHVARERDPRLTVEADGRPGVEAVAGDDDIDEIPAADAVRSDGVDARDREDFEALE